MISNPYFPDMTSTWSNKSFAISTSMASLAHPVNSTQWNTSLQYVKILYFKGRLKQCAAQCAQLLLLSKASASKHPEMSVLLRMADNSMNSQILYTQLTCTSTQRCQWKGSPVRPTIFPCQRSRSSCRQGHPMKPQRHPFP